MATLYLGCNFFFNYKFRKISRWSPDVHTKIIFIILVSVLKAASIRTPPQQPMQGGSESSRQRQVRATLPPAGGCRVQAQHLGVRKARTQGQLWPWVGTLSCGSHCSFFPIKLPASQRCSLRFQASAGTALLATWIPPHPPPLQTSIPEEGNPCQSRCKPSEDLNKH